MNIKFEGFVHVFSMQFLLFADQNTEIKFTLDFGNSTHLLKMEQIIQGKDKRSKLI